MLPDDVINMLAKREHRLCHFLWHEVHDSWLSYGKDTQEEIRKLGWEPPRPSLKAKEPKDEGSSGFPILDNNSGEDFLFMHRQMIEHVNHMIEHGSSRGSSHPKVEGWEHVPSLNEQGPLFEVPGRLPKGLVRDEILKADPWPPRRHIEPGTTSTQYYLEVKADKYYDRLQKREKVYTDPEFLKTISLGELYDKHTKIWILTRGSDRSSP
ncbi:MAG: hypothetical protein HY731_12405 [Candidatus Tectomicrobia bacterium]|nr:hypothetical protein [Candidatus Tectomicrobia bacterium]